MCVIGVMSEGGRGAVVEGSKRSLRCPQPLVPHIRHNTAIQSSQENGKTLKCVVKQEREAQD